MEQIKRNQSSVEWLFEQIARRQGSILQTIPFYDDNQDLLQQAKAIHKEEIENAVDGFPIHTRSLNGNDYYNEHYGNN